MSSFIPFVFAAVIISLKTGYECADNRCQSQIEDQQQLTADINQEVEWNQQNNDQRTQNRFKIEDVQLSLHSLKFPLRRYKLNNLRLSSASISPSKQAQAFLYFKFLA